MARLLRSMLMLGAVAGTFALHLDRPLNNHRVKLNRMQGLETEEWHPKSKNTKDKVDTTAMRFFYLNGEPKSGTMWFEHIMHEIFRYGCASSAECALTSQSPEPGTTTLSVSREGNRTKSMHAEGSIQFTAAKGKHTIPGFNHRDYFDFGMPDEMTERDIDDKAAKVLGDSKTKNWLVVMRDPRAVLMSSCRHLQEQNCDTWILKHMEALIRWTDLRYRMFSAIASQSEKGGLRPRAKIVFFENLKDHFDSEAKNLADYLGFELNDKELYMIQHSTSIDRLDAKPEEKEMMGQVCGFKDSMKTVTFEMTTQKMEAILAPELNKLWQC